MSPPPRCSTGGRRTRPSSRRPRLVDLVADATVLKLGRSLAVTEVSLYSDGGGPDDLTKPVAHATITYSLALLGDGPIDPDPTGGTGIQGAIQS